MCTSGLTTRKVLIGVSLPSNASFSSAKTFSGSRSEIVGIGIERSAPVATPNASSNLVPTFLRLKVGAPASVLTAVGKPMSLISLRSSTPCDSKTRWRTKVISSATSSALPPSSA